MAGDFGALLSSIGFPASDAAARQGQIQRKVDLGKSNIDIANQDAIRNMSADYEARGVLGNSGEAVQGFARQAAKNANDLTGLDISAADDTLTNQENLMKAKAAQDAQNQSLAQQKLLFDAQMQQQQAQAAAYNQLLLQQQQASDNYYGIGTRGYG